MKWDYTARRDRDGQITTGTVEADTRDLARIRALDAALDALGPAPLELIVAPAPPAPSRRTDGGDEPGLDGAWDLDG